MAFVEINAKYADCLREQGFVHPGQFLAAPAVIISGHPDRHVAQVSLGERAHALHAFLKREHAVGWRDRLAGAWAGFGLVSRSAREALTLRALARAGIGCPEWIAHGEDEQGRAFLLVRDLTGALDLRLFLQQQRSAAPGARRRFLRQLGAALARIHAAGFAHPDLYAKHVLVDPATEAISFLDWQRSRRRRHVGWRQRWRDLAALDASLADHLVTPRERLVRLRSYLRRSCPTLREPGSARRHVERIRQQATRLLRRRHVRGMPQPPLAAGTQNLIWLDGEALCVTRAFWAALRGQVPDWLAHAARVARGREPLTRTWVAVPDTGHALLVRRRAFRPLGWLSWWRRRPPPSPELRQAGLLFRLQRYGVRTPRLLAVGQQWTAPGYLSSFLLIEPVRDATPLAVWLAQRTPQPTPAECRLVLYQGLELLRRLHEAGCYLVPGGACPLLVGSPPDAATLFLGDVEGVRAGRPHPLRAERDRALLRAAFTAAALAHDERPVASAPASLTADRGGTYP